MPKYQKLSLYKPKQLSFIEMSSFYFREFIQKEAGFKNTVKWMSAIRKASLGKYLKAYSCINYFWDGRVTEKKSLEYMLLKAYLEFASGQYALGDISFEFFFIKLDCASDINIDEKIYLGIYAYECCVIAKEHITFDINKFRKYQSKKRAIDFRNVDIRLKYYFPVASVT